MYSQRIIEQRLSYFARTEGWEPQRHTFAEVSEFIEYMKKITTIVSNSKNSYVTVTANLTEKRIQEIARWVQNERVLCSFDYNYWRDNYAYVVDEGGQVRKFKNRKSQDVFDSVVSELEEQQAGIQILC